MADEQKESKPLEGEEGTRDETRDGTDVDPVAEARKMIEDAKAEAEVEKANLKADYEKRLKQRDEIIKSLINGKADEPKRGVVDDLNARRKANAVKW